MRTPNDFGRDPFGGQPFGHNPFGAPPVITAPTPPQQRTNRLATLSVVFAFVFAPAGAILGHIGLSQMRRTGERGRERALIGIALSYLIIVIAIVALVVSVITADRDDIGSRVGNHALPGLLLTLDEVKQIAPAANLSSAHDSADFDRGAHSLQVQPSTCLNAYYTGVGPDYVDSGSTGTAARMLVNGLAGDTGAVVMWERVIAFKDAAAATGFVAMLTEQWQDCENRKVVVETNGNSYDFRFGSVRRGTSNPDMVLLDGNTPNNSVPQANDRLIVAKANVVVDLLVRSDRLGDALADVPETMAAQILARIPD